LLARPREAHSKRPAPFRTQLGDHLAPTRDGDGEPPRDDDIKGIRHLALAHEHVAALEVERLQFGGEARTLGILEIAEDLDPVEAVLGNLRFHLYSCICAASRIDPIPACPR